MPFVQPPAQQWLANQLAEMKNDIRALKAGQTTFITDPETGNAQAIIGNLTYDPAGNTTGLSGFGIAVLIDGGWVQLLANGSVGTAALADGSVTYPKLQPTVAARGYRQAALTLAEGAFTKIAVDTATFDTSSRLDLVNGQYKVPPMGITRPAVPFSHCSRTTHRYSHCSRTTHRYSRQRSSRTAAKSCVALRSPSVAERMEISTAATSLGW